MYAIGLAIAGLTPLIRLIDVRSIPILVISALITGIGSGFAAPLNYGIQADNTDYIELSMGIRAEGAIASLSSFISKCAMGIGGAIPGYLLALAGFDAAAKTQPDSVITVIILCLIGLPALVDLLAIVTFWQGLSADKREIRGAESDSCRKKRYSTGRVDNAFHIIRIIDNIGVQRAVCPLYMDV